MSSELGRLRHELAARGAVVRVTGEDLQLRAPRGALDADLRARLRKHKAALIAQLEAESKGPAPLGSTQRQLWFGEQLDAGSEAHLLVVSGHLHGPLDLDRFERALTLLLARHEALRTQIEPHAGLPRQRVLAPEQVPSPLVRDDNPDAMRLDPGQAPLLRLRVHRDPDRAAHHHFELRIHHIILDGVGLEVLLDELSLAYAGQPLPPVATTPRALAHAEALHAESPAFATALATWVAQLEGARRVDLPTDHPRTLAPSSAGGRVLARVPASAWTQLQALTQAHDTTAFIAIAAVLAELLRRWVGRERVWIGIPHSNRDHPSRARVVASLVETTLLECDGRGEPSFIELLARTRSAWFRCLEHAELPLDRVLAALGVRQLPDLTLNFIPFAKLGLRLPGVEVDLRGHMPGSRFDLTVYAYPREGGLDLEFAYRSGLFEAPRMQALADQLLRLLASVLDHPARPTRQISLAPEPLTPPAPLAPPAPFDFLARLSAIEAKRSAIRSSQGHLDYAHLCAQAQALRTQIVELHRALGAPHELRVAIHASRCPALASAIVGIWAAGASFVILDGSHPAARLLHQTKRARPDAWLSLAPSDPVLARGLATLPKLRMDLDPRAGRELELSCPSPSPDTLAWIPFTSGSTGVPEGLLVEHGPLARSFAWYIQRFGITADDRFALLAGLGHDPFLRDLLLPLSAGASVSLPPLEPAHMGLDLAAWIAAEGITTLHLTPALARIIARAGQPFPDLRRVLFGGAPLHGSDVERWHTLAPRAKLYNGYGATETPQIAALHPCSAEDHNRAQVPIGRGVAGTRLELRRPGGTLAAVGELAEIIVCGPNLARAYLGEESPQTPLGTRFHTGDLARSRADGAIEYVGRSDRQLALRGHRIEAAEVEAALLRFPGIRAAGVCLSPGHEHEHEHEPELIAGVVGIDAATLPALRQALATNLPAAMIPTRIAALEALPLTPNAKLDTLALAEAIGSSSARVARGARPDSGWEQALAGLWSALLGVPEIYREDDFFALGGHSLLSVELVGQIESALGLRAPVTLVFEHPTLRGQARALTQLGSPATPARRLSDTEPAHASLAQERLWLLQRLEPDAPQLQLDHRLRLDESLDRARLDAALVTIETRHEPLRTRFELAPEGLLQIIDPPRSKVLEGAPPAHLRFDLERGPVWRAFAWVEPQGHAHLRLVIHHIAGDAGAMQVLIRDLLAAYRGEAMAPITLRYRDLAALQRRQIDSLEPSPRDPREPPLSGLDPLELPLARARPPRQAYAGAHADLELGSELGAALLARASQAGATSYMAVLTGLVAVLARWSGSTDIAVGSPVGLRPHPAAAELVGPFLNLALVRIDASEDPSLDALLERVREAARAAFIRAQLPFERLLQGLAPTRRLDRTPLFQVLFNMVDPAPIDAAWAELGATRLPDPHPVARYDLAVYAQARASGLQLRVVYDRALFVPEQIEQFLAHLDTALTQLAADPQVRLSALALAPPPELARPAAGPRIDAASEGVFARLCEHAGANPTAPALRVGGTITRYDELEALVERFAAQLGDLPHAARVGLACRHDASMIAAMIAVLARGCAYVPLDPHLPPARLRELVEDAQLSALACVPELRELAARLAPACLRRVVLDPAHDPPEASTTLAARGAIEPGAPAYLLYTSGSTGRPKGVIQTQANLIHHAQSYAQSLALAPGDRMCLVASYGFDAAVMDIYAAVLTGAQLCLIDLGDPEQLAHLAEHLCKAQVEIFHATPTVFRELLAQLDAGAPAPPLRCVVLGGEEARAEDALALREHFGPDCRLINGLGPTECTVALQQRVDTARVAPGSLPIGYPCPGISVHLRTPVGPQVARFGVGEIVLESERLALGYWRRPEQTRAAFETLPSRRRRYATGDLAQLGPDGALRFVGRRDTQVEIRGRRVELGEIEAKLRASAQVREVGVSLRGSPATPRLVAHLCVTPDAAPRFDPDSLRAELGRTLPSWMIPNKLIAVDALPKTSTGKLDRRALAGLSESTPARPSDLRLDRSAQLDPAQVQIRSIWSEFLAVPGEELALDRDFFASGGDSLAAVRLARAASLRLGFELAVVELFEGATIATIAARLRGPSTDEPIHRARASLTRPELGPAAALASTTDEHPLVLVLPPGAPLTLVDPLAQALALEGREAWILRPPSFGHEGPLPTLERILDDCAQALETLSRSRAPYLAGVSNGGLLALLLARDPRIHACGVALLDTIPPQLLAADPFEARPLPRRHAAFMANWAGLRVAPEQLDVPKPELFEVMREIAIHAGEATAALSIEELAHLVELHELHASRVWRILSQVQLGDHLLEPGSERPAVHLYAAQGPPKLPLTSAWLQRWPELAVHAIPGDHLGMLGQPHVDVLARSLSEVLSSTMTLL